jgi:hypothetical protein
MCERNLGSTLSTFAINRQVGCHERLVRTVYGMSLLMKTHSLRTGSQGELRACTDGIQF